MVELHHRPRIHHPLLNRPHRPSGVFGGSHCRRTDKSSSPAVTPRYIPKRVPCGGETVRRTMFFAAVITGRGTAATSAVASAEQSANCTAANDAGYSNITEFSPLRRAPGSGPQWHQLRTQLTVCPRHAGTYGPRRTSLIPRRFGARPTALGISRRDSALFTAHQTLR